MKIHDILSETPGINYASLQDAGPDYEPGDTQIWYFKQDLGRDMQMGYDYLKNFNKLPNPANLHLTHVMVGTVKETDPHQIYNMMQGEIWSPNGEARNLISRLKVGHTSMAIGDIVVTGGKKLIADRYYFKDLITGDKV